MSTTLNLQPPASRGIIPMSSRALRAAGFASLALVVSLSACGRGDAAEGTPPAAIVVSVGPEAIGVATQTTLSIGPILSGSLVAERTAQIRAEVPGAVVQVFHDPGAVVTKGTSLAKIDDRAIEDAYLGARSGFTAAQTAADLAGRELARAERLHAAGAVSDRDLENARRADLSARSMLDDAKARLSAAEKNRDATNVLAPYDGVVSERFVNPGDIVNPGAPLFALVDPSTMRLEAAVPATELAQVRVGAPVRFSVTGYPDRVFEGRISSVNPSADPQTRQVRLFVRIPNAGQRLVAGLFAEGRVASETRDALTVPALAIDQRGLTPQVVRLKDGIVERVAVKVGALDEATNRVEILDGLAAGDTVLVGAALGVSVGSRVRVSTPSDTSTQR
jgi:membrane fusion protein (multidrug efflux system)